MQLGPCALKTNSKSSKCTWWGLAKPKQQSPTHPSLLIANRSLPSCLDINTSANGYCHVCLSARPPHVQLHV